ncbi:MAG: alpha/beta hydrolase, partial [Trichodesmium sp.]
MIKLLLNHTYQKLAQTRIIPWLTSVTIGTVAAVSVSFPVQAAEEIRFVFDSVYLFLPVSSLETFAREGKIDQELERFFVLTGTTEKGKAAFQKALLEPVSIDPNLLSRLLYTDEVARLLKYFGRVINVEGGKNGQNLIREALVDASLNDQGLNLINILNQFSTNVEINLKKSIKLGKEVKVIIGATSAFIAEVKKLATIEIEKTDAVDFSQLPDLRQPGKLAFEQQTWNLVDPQRQRKLYVEVYQPQKW